MNDDATNKKILSSEDLINGFLAPGGVKCGLSSEQVYVFMSTIRKPEGEIPVWMFHGERMKPVEAIVKTVFDNIRQGKDLDPDLVPGGFNLATDVLKRSRGSCFKCFYDYKTKKRFYDIKTKRERMALAFIVGCGYEIRIPGKEMFEILSTIINRGLETSLALESGQHGNG